MTSTFIGVTVLVALYSLWVRRDTWLSRWEIGVTLAIALQACSLVLMSPWAAETLRPWVHHMLPMWNLQQLVGHICFVTSLAAVTFHILARVAPRERAGNWFCRKVVRPVLAGLIALVAVFIAADGDYAPDGLTTRSGSPWEIAYWIVLSGLIFYVSARLLPLMLAARSDPRAKGTIRLYSVAMTFGLTSLLVQMRATWIDADLSAVVWLLVGLSVVVFSFGSARSWQAKTAWFANRDNTATGNNPPPAMP
ncbi:hypothetical protein [Mycolicibacter minnesotensis]